MIVHTAMSLFARNSSLSAADQHALESVCTLPRRYTARHDLLHTGDSPPGLYLILSGIACRFATLPGGSLQVYAYLVPGDVCGVRTLVGMTMDHSVRALSALDVALMPREDVRSLADASPGMSKALLRLSQTEAAISRQWLLNVGHRNAFAALAHLFCELFLRLKAAGLADENDSTCHLPLTQTDLAEALALSPVHLNRTLMKMRRSGIATLAGRKLYILDMQALEEAARFDPAYLCESRTPAPPLETHTVPSRWSQSRALDPPPVAARPRWHR